MKLKHIRVSGFRGFRELVEIPIAPDFTVIDGRNGVGKSTIFDAIEVALTGELTKYGDAKSGGETVEDYLWWRGDGPPPSERFVEVTFSDGSKSYTIRRTPVAGPDPDLLRRLEAEMVNLDIAPPAALSQLCAASLIRDEYIASLSLDLSETDRYAKLRQAIGASDADAWTRRALDVLNLAKKRGEAARAEVTTASTALAQAIRRSDEIRASIPADEAITEAAKIMTRLLAYGSTPPDQLLSPTREFVARRERSIQNLSGLVAAWDEFAVAAVDLAKLEQEVEAAKTAIADAQSERAALPPAEDSPGIPAQRLVSELHELRRLGVQIGLVDHSCPLCATQQDQGTFEAGLATVMGRIERIDAEASKIAEEVARRREALSAAERKIAQSQEHMARLAFRASERRGTLTTWLEILRDEGLPADAPRESVDNTIATRRVELEQARRALSVLSTVEQNEVLQGTTVALAEAQSRLSRAQDRAGRARKVESAASALHDAARRAGSETLDLRLERMLPLMSELYSRLRPHPVWQDIEYSIRGDLRRFLSLQVGDGLNPQFLFSSGQRRATGLAFLLSIHLSLAWSRWRTILLDDPVQHVDDFRTVNLAEVLAQLVTAGRQVIVAVEDPALADLLTRRMPVAAPGRAVRLTLGLNESGASSVVGRRDPAPMIERVLAA